MSAQRDETTRTYLPEEYLSGRLADGCGRTERALLYLRVSHDDSARSGLSIPGQERACREACRRQGVEVVGVYKDEAKSAYRDSEDRPGFLAMIDAATRSFGTDSPVTMIVVSDSTRFSRDEWVNLTFKRGLLPQYGIVVVTASDGLWENQLEAVVEAIDRDESRRNAQRTMRGMVANARAGHVTAGKTPYGYAPDKTVIGQDSHGKDMTRTSWIPDPALQADVQRLFGLLSDGIGIHNVALTMNREGRPSPTGRKWTKTTVQDLAKRVHCYEGTLPWNVGRTVPWQDAQGRKRRRRILKDPAFWVRTPNAYPPMIDPGTAAKVRVRFAQDDDPERYHRQRRKIADELRPRGEKVGGHSQPGDGINNHSRNSRWVLTGIAVCGGCGNNLVGHRHTRKSRSPGVWHYYLCGGYHRTNGGVCRSYYVPAERFEGAVFEGVAERLATDFGRREVRRHIGEVVGALRKDAGQHIGALEGQTGEREFRIRTVLEEGLRRGFDPQACNEVIGDLRAEAADLRDKARAYQTILAKADGIEDEVQALLSSTGRLLRTWELLEPAERRARLSEVVAGVVVDVASGRGPLTAEIRFRGLLQDVQAQRLQIKTAVARKAKEAETPAFQGFRPPGECQPTEWLPAPDSNQEPTG